MESALGSLLQPLTKVANDELKYVWFYKAYIKRLNDELIDLENERKRRQEEVNRANLNAQEIYADVTKWLERAENIIGQAREVMEKHNNSKKGCFRGAIPNPSTRFLTARRAEKYKQEIDKLKQTNNDIHGVSHPRVPTGIVRGNYEGPDPEYWPAKSRDELLVHISEALLDAKIRIVGIWGATGVGKSILLKQLEKQIKEREFNYDFDAVTMATVSTSPNWETVQDDLGYRLGLKMDKENSKAQKADRLRDRLSQKCKFLIILDDIWEKIDLGNLGIPFDEKHPKIKLLLTSRSEQVLRSKMDSEHNFHLGSLTEKEAIGLFEKILGDRGLEKATLVNLAKKCLGLPRLISIWATYLKSQPSATSVETLSTLRDSNGLGIESIIDESLKFIYHLLKSGEAKSLFSLCGQIGAQVISTDYLMILGMGLGHLKGASTMEKARKKVNMLLGNLKDSCLLEDCNKSFLKINGLMGDAALSIASETHTSLVIRNRKMLKDCSADNLRRCKAISICFPVDTIHELPEELICPELDMLLVFVYDNNAGLKIPDAFFKNTRELKILHLFGMTLHSLPSSIRFLNKLHTLYLLGVRTRDLKIIGKLKTLQVLTLSGSEISRIPKEIGDLENLRFLDLMGCYRLEVIEPNVLGSLIHMEELRLPASFDKWDAEGTNNASLTELNNMSSLSTLNINVPSAALLTNNMPFQQLVRYKIYIGKMWRFGDFDEERTLSLELESSSSKMIVKELLQTALKMTQDLCLYGWIEFEESITELSKDGFPELKHLRVENCRSIKYIIHSKKPNAVPVLESLSLCCLTNLQEIWQGHLPPKSVSSLKVIKIESCDKLRNLFSFSSVKDLPNLEEIEVNDCEMIQEIITYTEMDSTDVKEVIAPDKFELLELKCLRKLKLAYLRNISSFFSKGNREIVEDDGSTQFEFLDGRQVSFPCLESLTLCELPKLRKISHNEYPLILQGLQYLELCRCGALLYAFDASFLLQLRKLEFLTIESCESMENIFNLEGLDANRTDLNDQPLKIKLLKLTNLPKLKAIWNKTPKNISNVFELEKLEVYGCSRLKYLFSSSMAKSLENISQISITSCRTMTEILMEEENDDQEINFSSLSYLSISNMENLAMFSRGNHHYSFPRLKQLMISCCPKMRTFVSVKQEKEALDATDYAFSLFNQKVDLPNLEKLVLQSLSMIGIWDNNLSKDSFYKLASIQIEKCARILSIFPPHLEERLQNLTQVKVESCDLLEVLFGCGQKESKMSNLQEIRQTDLPGLRHVVLKSQSLGEAALSFPSLRDIVVANCHRLISLFPNSIARGLSELVNMNISSCGGLEEVISFDGKEGSTALTEAMIFHNLSSLQLEKLNNLVHFCSGHYELYFPFLKKLSIIECVKLKAFILRPQNLVSREERLQYINSTSNTKVDTSPLFDEKVIFPNLQELQIQGLEFEEIWPKSEPAGFRIDLKTFTVENCHQLSIIFPSHMLPNLHSLESLSVRSCNALEVVFKLEKYRQKVSRGKSTTKVLKQMRQLTVSSCESMQHIVAMRDDDPIEETYQKAIMFPQLSTLKLSELPRLGTFCHKNHKIELPSLEKLEINDCGSVEILAADSSQHCKPLLLVEKLGFPRMVSMGIDNMQKLTELWHISKEGIQCSSEAFCQLKFLEVSRCDMLLTIFPSKMIRAFRNLEELNVNYCKSLESVFESTSTGLSSGTESNSSNDVVPTTFALRKLDLNGLPRLKHVWNVEDPRWFYLSFEELNIIGVIGCRILRYLFPASIAKFLPKMIKLRMMDCEGVEGIIWNGESAYHQALSTSPLESTYNFSLDMNSVEWPSLNHLRLQNCPKAKIFASVQQKVNIPRLKSLGSDATTLANRQFLDEIYVDPSRLILRNIQNQAWVESIPWLLLLKRLPNLQTLRISKAVSKEIFPNSNEMEGAKVSCKPGILDIAKKLEINKCHHLTILPRFSAVFHNLTDLAVMNCHGLQHLATSSVASALVQLTELSIYECNSLEEIVTYDRDTNGNRARDDDHADIISFPQLRQLNLHDLPSLRSFSSTTCNFSFPSLRIVSMANLPMMHVFCEGDFTTPYKHRITRSVRAWHNYEINTCLICPGS